MSTEERFRASAARSASHFGASTVTVKRGAVGLLESISGGPVSLTCGTALAGAASLPLVSAVAMSGRLDPGVALSVTGHSATYTVQSLSTPSGVNITATISPGLESDVNGEAVTLSARTLTFTGGAIELNEYQLPAGWSVGAESEIWALVPSSTGDGQEPRAGDRVTAPFAATINRVGGRERVEYIVLLTPHASEEAA